MANRAYLFFIDKPEDVGSPDRNAIRYFDSRHNVPFAWLLFFGPHDIVLKPVRYENSEWNDVYLVAPWPEARARFLERCKYLPEWFEGRVLPGEAETFVAHVEDFAGEFLQMDGQEILADEIECERSWRAMLEALQAGAFEPRRDTCDEICFECILNEADEQKMRDQIFGITYWSVGEPLTDGR